MTFEGKLGGQALAERWRHPSNVPPLTSQLPAREHGGAGWRTMADGAERAGERLLDSRRGLVPRAGDGAAQPFDFFR